MINKKVFSCRPISIRSLGVKPGKARVIAANRLTGVRMNAYGRSLIILSTPDSALEWCGEDCSLEMLTAAAPSSLAECCPMTPVVEEFFGLAKKAAPKAEPKAEVVSEEKTTEEAPAPKKTTKKKASKKASTKKAAAKKEEAPVEEAKPEVAPEEPKAEEPKDFDPFA